MWNILVVDDERVNLQLIGEMLKTVSACEFAEDGRQALEAFQKSVDESRPFDVILMDIAMPEMDGVEVVRRIRKFEENQGILLGEGVPIIMVTAYKEQFLNAFNEGCDDYIVKPISFDSLMEKIREILAERDRKES